MRILYELTFVFYPREKKLTPETAERLCVSIQRMRGGNRRRQTERERGTARARESERGAKRRSAATLLRTREVILANLLLNKKYCSCSFAPSGVIYYFL